MGWEDVLLPPLAKLIDVYPAYAISPPIERTKLAFGPDRKQFKQVSPNHWEMGLSAELLRSAAYGSEDEWQTARTNYLVCLDLHLNKIGLWTTEQYTGAPHGGFYLASMMAARMALIVRHETATAFNDADQRLETDLDEYTLRLFRYLHATATADGEIICCGERMKNGPAAPQQSAIYREINSLPHPNRRQIDRQVDDYFWLSLRATRKLIYSNDRLDAIANEARMQQKSLPFTAQAIAVERWKTGHKTYYLDDGGDGTCTWTFASNRKGVKWGARGTEAERSPARVRKIQTETNNVAI